MTLLERIIASEIEELRAFLDGKNKLRGSFGRFNSARLIADHALLPVGFDGDFIVFGDGVVADQIPINLAECIEMICQIKFQIRHFEVGVFADQ